MKMMVVYFSPLSRADFARIANLMLGELTGPLEERGIAFSWTPAAADAIAAKAYGGKRGARDLRNTVRRLVEDRIATILVDNCDSPPTAITVDAAEAGGENAVSVVYR